MPCGAGVGGAESCTEGIFVGAGVIEGVPNVEGGRRLPRGFVMYIYELPPYCVLIYSMQVACGAVLGITVFCEIFGVGY